jgi:hypothetical protein
MNQGLSAALVEAVDVGSFGTRGRSVDRGLSTVMRISCPPTRAYFHGRGRAGNALVTFLVP